ncbi:MAG: hypothetical protein Q8918_17895 [Bacteroidota bacterium]|nr:hypothetical protein [Bacteroidota bacterium]MDP4213883.1 hypothetical protein [Bacteroidota bacterium]MDP4251977.1 hypothetical protein [Bacteroidota bacterium]
MSDYRFLNRSAIVVTPKAPFWDWVKKSDDIDEAMLTEVKKESNIYLIPGYESEDDIALAIERHLVQNYADIFISELEAWYTDPETFPEITYERFNEWFIVSSHSMIFDTVNKPLKRE